MLALTYCFHFLKGGSQSIPNPGPNFFKLVLRWHIFRSWAPFFCSWPALGRSLCVFCSSWSKQKKKKLQFFAFWLAPGLILERPESRGDFGVSQLSFFDVLSRAHPCNAKKNSGCAKTRIVPRFLFACRTSQALSSSHKTMQNHSQSLSNRASYKD